MLKSGDILTERSGLRKVEDEEYEKFLYGPCQTQQSHWKLITQPFLDVYMQCKWVKSKAIDLVRSEAKRLETEILHFWTATPAAKSERFLHRILIGDDNPKSKSWGKRSRASTSTIKPNINESKLRLCIWGNQLVGMYCDKIIAGDRYRLQLMRLSRTMKEIKPVYLPKNMSIRGLP